MPHLPAAFLQHAFKTLLKTDLPCERSALPLNGPGRKRTNFIYGGAEGFSSRIYYNKFIISSQINPCFLFKLGFEKL